MKKHEEMGGLEMILNVSVVKESAGCLKGEWKGGHS